MKPDLELRKDLNNKEYINLALGEPYLVSKNLKKVLEKHNLKMHIKCNSNIISHSYKPPTGIPKLVELLKQKTGYRHVIITNGAKQALSAVFYAIKSKGYESVYLPVPYWVSFPTLIKKENLAFVTEAKSINSKTAILLTSPNNPNGFTFTNEEFDQVIEDCISDNLPLIHDGAYNTEVYINDNNNIVDKKVTFKVHSYSKSLGLSGLRVGYVATNSDQYASLLSEYLEITTTGVSSASQQVILRLEKLFLKNPEIYEEFTNLCKKDLNKNRKKLKELKKEIANTRFMSYNGMFSFLPKGPKCDEAFSKAKVKALNGELFGKSDYIRISIALNPKKFAKVIDKLNEQV